MSWCDIGVNFTDKRLLFEPVFERALAADVSHIIITGTSLDKSQKAIQLAEKYPNHLSATVGVHPHDASQFNVQTINELKILAKSDRVAAIGECGLDFNRNFSTPKEQLFAFEQQLKLACELGLPVFLHERDAFDAQIELLSKYRKELKGGVVHCFTGNTEQMNRYLDLDLYIGITGWVCDLKRGHSLREAVKSLPLNRILLETDAPYLRPKGLANNRKVDNGNNEPAYLPFVATEVANLMATDIKTLQLASQANTQALFNISSSNVSHAK
ncbi:TatD family hydrolase [Paraglaciecola arctica]|uniref:TatD DNase family protein n=1 Tax=Paraglaciecola arctica BSs20135 TaxID=493475 RepID=K6XMI9_9ALTE|nr:TatD family hydrolase [Paraglaciecola arctica]GAC21849.1 TatD DNase family protein [Paraglaciecola arctica BSs20135]